MWESKISGWQADWREATEQVARNAEALAGLIGARVTGAWTVWIAAADEWFADMPVVLEFDSGEQLEVCWQKMDNLSISWSTIDLERTPQAWVDGLSWRPWAHASLNALRDQVITHVARTEVLLSTTDVDHPRRPPREVWMTGGLWFGTAGPGLHIFNALDENGLSNTAEPESKTHLVAPAMRIEDRRLATRPLHATERAILELLLTADFPGVEELRAQARDVEADSDGLVVGLVARSDSPPARVITRTPVQANVDGDGFDGGLLLFVDNGKLSALEYWWVTEEVPDRFPPLSAIGTPRA